MGIDKNKKDCILVEAAQKFAKWGFKKTSMDEIAKAAGVAKGTLYLVSKSKDELFYQVLTRQIRRWDLEVLEDVDPALPADQQLLQASQRTIETMDKYPLIKDFFFGKYSSLIPSVKNKIPELRRLSLGPIREILQTGIRQGTFKGDLNVEQVANILLDLMTSTFLFHMNEHTNMDDLRDREKTAFDLIFNGIRAKA
ncbi:MAG: TetR/AcrR family transcriptional regulator [Bacteriovoracaceae bacterium]|nr:TetR/AcrR family transcriptional regulator [Bacteriovoracaceae bacterium]